MTKNLIFYVKEYRNELEKNKGFNYLLNGEMYIDYRVNDKNVEEIIINENTDSITIKFKENDKLYEDRIEKGITSLRVLYSRYGEHYIHSIIDNVEYFDVVDKNNIFYIKIKVIGEKERIYCYEK
ncbi:hypothetical protein [Clostridium sp. B9]|uniref:hypothetical protein n=1 Tax=Clostridium sp. B9 TaxID=3423224 RepID=UPI003D2ED119